MDQEQSRMGDKAIERRRKGRKEEKEYGVHDHDTMQRAHRPDQPVFDNKMIHLKGYMIVNDNAWTKLTQHTYGEDAANGDHSAIADDECRAEVSTKVDEFIATFDRVCSKHNTKKVHQPGSRLDFSKKN